MFLGLKRKLRTICKNLFDLRYLVILNASRPMIRDESVGTDVPFCLMAAGETGFAVMTTYKYWNYLG